MAKPYIAILDCLWHPKWAERDALREKGFYVYDMRTWDEGCGNSLETVVIVNYEGSVVTNFEITDWDLDEGNRKTIFDMYAWLDDHPEIEQRNFDTDLEKQVQEILNTVKA